MIRYEIIVYWRKEDQAFIAEVPELSGCAADGATYQEAIANVEIVIREWIESAKEMGAKYPSRRDASSSPSRVALPASRRQTALRRACPR